MARKALSAGILVCSCLIFSACGRTVIEWNILVGKLVDSDTGYYAYSTDLPARKSELVSFSLASRERLERQRTFESDRSTAVYPRIAFDPPRTYATPDQLASCLPPCPELNVAPGDTLVLGYYMKQVFYEPRINAFAGKDEVGATQGISWSHLSERCRREVSAAILDMQEQAASVGAHGIVDIAVFWTRNNIPYGGAGVYLTGRAIAVGRLATVFEADAAKLRGPLE
jgi:hypothetical protein